MTVEDVLEYVKYGELAKLGVVQRLSNATTQEDAERQILSYINLGLIELHKRFNLRIEETVIELKENQTIYVLDDANVYNDPANLTGYLSALPGEFNSILAAYDEDGYEYNINREEDALSILTPSWNSIQIPNPVEGTAVFVLYSAMNDKITWETDSATTIAKTIPIPPALLEALGHYIGYRGHGALDGSVQAENNTHYNRFDKSCAKAKELGLLPEDSLTFSHTLESKGFV